MTYNTSVINLPSITLLINPAPALYLEKHIHNFSYLLFIYFSDMYKKKIV